MPRREPAPPPLDIRFKPMKDWPVEADAPAGDRQLAKGWPIGLNNTMAYLKWELEKLGASDCVIEVDAPSSSFARIDGAPKGGESCPVNSQRVAVWFELEGKVRVIRCNSFTSWTRNLKAVQMTLKANRLLLAYGTTTKKQQYAGHVAQLPAASSTSDDFPNHEAAARWLIVQAGGKGDDESVQKVIEDPAYRRSIYKQAAKKLHPDSNPMGGVLMARVNKANDQLESAGEAR